MCSVFASRGWHPLDLLDVSSPSASLHDQFPGKRIDLAVSASAYSRAFKGSASPVDAAELMQLIHALFTCE